MLVKDRFYIAGQWQEPKGSDATEVVNPATEEPVARVAMGNREDVDRAVAAARAAFDDWSQTTPEQRAQYLERIVAGLEARTDEIAQAITSEMGSPCSLVKPTQIGNPLFTFKEAAELARTYQWETDHGKTHVIREPIGVCALITPWNFPLNQIAGKVAPALKSARRWLPIPRWTWFPSPAPPGPAPRLPPRRRRPSSVSPRNWAGSRPTSFFRMPISAAR